ncbi:hypothetical protein LOZ65_005351 [Ophidiomyces ophidiicola]|nr:hypothetical protein LOZ65_005351 [Ophidiomyces ophidiicola]
MIESDVIKNKLNIIDKVRARGVGDHIALPQLVVCGDQSAGKSSVLEGITGIPFPRKDGLCTRFATEIILRHAVCDRTITASVIPHASRDPEKVGVFRQYSRSLSSYDELPVVIEEVSRLFGLKGYAENDNAPAFAADVLRIEVIGDTGLHLTIVDLPGLIAVSEDEENIDMVGKLVDSYLENSRTIILAVLPAPSDIETQKIIQRARHFDKPGERTVGILTKPDLINKNTEGKVVQLLRNEGPTKLKLGFYLLKNPDPDGLKRGITIDERKSKELQWFQAQKWSKHRPDYSRIGVDALRASLQTLLEGHIERELPKVQADVFELLNKAEKDLEALGEERKTVPELRLFISKLGSTFSNLMTSATDGTYQGTVPDFFSEARERLLHNRLRARIHLLNEEFAGYMRQYSSKRRLNRRPNDETLLDIKRHLVLSMPLDTKTYAQLLALDEPEIVSTGEFHAHVKMTYQNTRGLELPGNCNHTLLMELFHEQSNHWPVVAKRHTQSVHNLVRDFVDRVLKQVVSEEHVRLELHRVINSRLRVNLDDALDELEKICRDEKFQPITYNHYFTDNIQRIRNQGLKEAVAEAFNEIKWTSTHPHIDKAKILSEAQNAIIVDMNEQTCQEATAALDAYCKVAMKTFVDNVCRQVIERHIVSKLPNVFNPTTVLSLTDKELQKIAAEPGSKTERRKELTHLVSMLKESLDDLQF